jgi:hypothetical protein
MASDMSGNAYNVRYPNYVLIENLPKSEIMNVGSKSILSP